MNRQQLDELRGLLRMYQTDITDRMRHSQQSDIDAKLQAHSLDYLKARLNDALQIIVDIESEIVDA